MDTQDSVTDGLTQCVAHVRLIAGLMITGPGLIDVEIFVYAMMLQDLAVRLEQLVEQNRQTLTCPDCSKGGEE